MSLFRLLSDTPKSRTDRAIGIDITVMHQEKTLNVVLNSPWKTASLDGTFIHSYKGAFLFLICFTLHVLELFYLFVNLSTKTEEKHHMYLHC